MGNSLRSFLGSYGGNLRFPCQVSLGTSGGIELSRASVVDSGHGGEIGEMWTVLYSVAGSTCVLNLAKVVVKDGNVDVERVVLGLREGIDLNPSWLYLMIQTSETDLLWTSLSMADAEGLPYSIAWSRTKRTVDPWGGLTDTKLISYGRGNRTDLLVVEQKKNIANIDHDEAHCKYNEVTMAHYFVISSGTPFNRTTPSTDIGLSVVAKVRPSKSNDGKLDVTVDGPERHPVFALIHMFDEVRRTEIWKPTMCSHCDSIRRGRMFWQSDSEDSDSVPVPLPRRGSSRQNVRGITNEGRFRGNANGNFIDTNYMVFRGRR